MDDVKQIASVIAAIVFIAVAAWIIVFRDFEKEQKREKERPDCKILSLWCPCCMERLAEKADPFKTMIGATQFTCDNCGFTNVFLAFSRNPINKNIG